MKAKPVLNNVTKKYNIKIYFHHGRPCNKFVPMLNAKGLLSFPTKTMAQNFIDNGGLKNLWEKLDRYLKAPAKF